MMISPDLGKQGETKMCKWYKFSAYNTAPMYGYGTKKEASKYQDILNRDRKINHYAVTVVKDSTAINGIEFNLSDELIAARDQ
jgi:hypothetical protein